MNWLKILVQKNETEVLGLIAKINTEREQMPFVCHLNNGLLMSAIQVTKKMIIPGKNRNKASLEVKECDQGATSFF
jgi:hypothetical protein